jgi:hypothetical protein
MVRVLLAFALLVGIGSHMIADAKPVKPEEKDESKLDDLDETFEDRYKEGFPESFYYDYYYGDNEDKIDKEAVEPELNEKEEDTIKHERTLPEVSEQSSYDTETENQELVYVKDMLFHMLIVAVVIGVILACLLAAVVFILKELRSFNIAIEQRRDVKEASKCNDNVEEPNSERAAWEMSDEERDVPRKNY